jgi:hypothetical protein
MRSSIRNALKNASCISTVIHVLNRGNEGLMRCKNMVGRGRTENAVLTINMTDADLPRWETGDGQELLKHPAAVLEYAPFLFDQISHMSRVPIEQAKGAQGKGTHGKNAAACLEVAEGVLISCLAGALICAI